MNFSVLVACLTGLRCPLFDFPFTNENTNQFPNRRNQERIRGRSVQPIELSEPKVRRVHCKNLPYKEGICRPHKTAIVALA